MQVVPAVGVHAFVSVVHAGGQMYGHVLRLNLATGSLEPHVHRTSAARPLTVSTCSFITCLPLLSLG